MARKPNPICGVCLKVILPGEGRMRRGLVSVHAECEKRPRRVRARPPEHK